VLADCLALATPHLPDTLRPAPHRCVDGPLHDLHHALLYEFRQQLASPAVGHLHHAVLLGNVRAKAEKDVMGLYKAYRAVLEAGASRFGEGGGGGEATGEFTDLESAKDADRDAEGGAGGGVFASIMGGSEPRRPYTITSPMHGSARSMFK
jgi:hypothetical protein